jgi:DNA-binding transcriptional ArsR family regulator
MEYTINGIRTKEQARILKILSVESRIKIIYLLKKKTLCVNALACNLGISQGAVSQHLRIMRDAGLVIDEKRGFHVHYRLNDTTFAEWKKLVDRVFDPDNGFEPESLRKESYCRDY